MAATTYVDQVIAELWQTWAQENLEFHGTLFQAGIVQREDNPIIQQGDEYTRERKVNPLSEIGAAQRILPNTDLTLKNQTTHAEYGVIVRRGTALSEEDLMKLITGVSPMQSAEGQFTEWWAREMELDLIQVIKAMFVSGGALRDTHYNDQSSSVLSMTMMNDTTTMFGEAMKSFNAITCHSNGLGKLQNLGLVDYVDAGEFGENVLRTGDIPIALGKQIVMNDVLCAPTAGVYPFYFTGGQPLRISFQQQIRNETDRDILKGGGTDIMATTAHYAPHIPGVSYSAEGVLSEANPAREDLDDPTRWEKVAANDTDIKLLRLDCLIA